MSRNMDINGERLLSRIRQLGAVGRDAEGRLVRVAATDEDRQGRDLFVAWARSAGLDVHIDRIGNIVAVWQGGANGDADPIMMGSHIDSVIDAGIYDGSSGVIAGLEVITALMEARFMPQRPIAVAAFTNEEGVRYAPDMMGSLVYAGGLDVEEALASQGTDGTRLGDQLHRIGYAGPAEPGFLRPHAYLELHIEQGPILEQVGTAIGVVENLQGISWQRIIIEGVANHAGTTPMQARRDAGVAAARILVFLRDLATRTGGCSVATVGTMRFEPDAINVIPGKASFTVDLRDPDTERLRAAEAELAGFLRDVAAEDGVAITTERLARFDPVVFSPEIVRVLEGAASGRQYQWHHMTSGAGHDAQMMARIGPAAMIFVPSRDGISHNPREFTADPDLVAGANVLLDAVKTLAGK
ncbi:Zn-dependent hydrolase [Pelagibacterium lacus]|uniref:Zn-dependent hydrolase n=1 Tax=Pelagibacterium lacus TaxID=2282655 RepID=A0A369VZJ7_9HYPH|nr:Zn-dependent hydrolase [Pelagibacterium lacus]RDE07816.1 Zn-dependent hydrolase [Pelagibacterium lacus]